VLKAPPGVCSQRLKLEYDKLLSSFAFKFNLRHYSLVRRLLRKHLSKASSVFTISVDHVLDGNSQKYVGLKHVTRVTMARLYMPWWGGAG
jgi:hypothetical protein